MFQFPGFAHQNNSGVMGSLPSGFPIRTSAGRRAFAPHRGFSQLVTSFVASESHRHPPCALYFFPLSFKCALRTPRSGLLRRQREAHTPSRPRSLSLDFSFNSISLALTSRDAAFRPLPLRLHVPNMSMTSFSFFSVVPGRLELPTSTLSV